MIGFVGPVGSGCTKAASLIFEVFEEEFSEFVNPVHVPLKVSDWFREELRESDPNWDDKTPCEQRSDLQEKGNEWRRNDLYSVASRAISQAMEKREQENFISQKPNIILSVIDSLKNPYEVEGLRRIYGSSFILIGITADEKVRWDRLQRIDSWGSVPRSEFKKIDERDRCEKDPATGEVLPWGQRVEEVFLLSDYYIINNDEESERRPELRKELLRVLNMAFSNPFMSPRKDEAIMHEAWSAGCRSLCLSRQVGAAVADKKGSLIAVGWNEAPKFGGGLYSEYSDQDYRCARFEEEENRFCRNNKEQEKIIDEIIDKFGEGWSNLEKDGEEAFTALKMALRSSRIMDLLEFSRAVHAEMEALVSVARTGSAGLVDSTMYVTSMPCHMCARHIVAAGIKEVVFIEPYYKSLAQDLHGDALKISNIGPPEPWDVVWFRQYEGIAPRRYLSTFKVAHDQERKKDGMKLEDFRVDYLDESTKLWRYRENKWYKVEELLLFPEKVTKGG